MGLIPLIDGFDDGRVIEGIRGMTRPWLEGLANKYGTFKPARLEG